MPGNPAQTSCRRTSTKNSMRVATPILCMGMMWVSWAMAVIWVRRAHNRPGLWGSSNHNHRSHRRQVHRLLIWWDTPELIRRLPRKHHWIPLLSSRVRTWKHRSTTGSKRTARNKTNSPVIQTTATTLLLPQTPQPRTKACSAAFHHTPQPCATLQAQTRTS